MIHSAKLGVLTIASGSKESANLREIADLKFVDGFTILAPAALTGTITVQVSGEREPATGDWRTAQTEGASGLEDVTLAAGKAVTIDFLRTKSLRIVSGAAEAADREFTVMGRTSIPDA